MGACSCYDRIFWQPLAIIRVAILPATRGKSGTVRFPAALGNTLVSSLQEIRREVAHGHPALEREYIHEFTYYYIKRLHHQKKYEKMNDLNNVIVRSAAR
jgi:hypothetical protein